MFITIDLWKQYTSLALMYVTDSLLLIYVDV